MRKVFLKSPIQTLSLALLIASTPTFAGYSNDPDCQAVSGSAQNSASKIYTQIDDSAKGTGDAIARTKSCVDQLLEQANRSVPDFGGVNNVVAKFAKDLMSQQACSLIGNAQTKAMAQLPSIPATYSGALQGAMNPANTNADVAISAMSAPSSSPSIWQRIANAF